MQSLIENLSQIAYVVALCLWAPILLTAWLKPPGLGRITSIAIITSGLALIYESYMTFVWAPTVVAPIRVDILFLLPVLGIIDGILAYRLLSEGIAWKTGLTKKAAIIALGIVCLSVPVTAVVGFIGSVYEMEEFQKNSENGKLYRFEAAFRDSNTQRRFFGELESVSNPWAGYYVTDDNSSRFKHLVINANGDYWLYYENLSVQKGHGSLHSDNQDKFLAEGSDVHKYKITLERQGQEVFNLMVQRQIEGVWGQYAAVRFRKASPPRFPILHSQNDKVRFIGVFSAKYDIRGNSFNAAQVWLWETNGKVWARYLQNYFTEGELKQFIYAQALDAKCTGPCNELNLSIFSGKNTVVKLKGLSENEIKANIYGKEVILNRGETVPGFFFDLAPLESEKSNKAWNEAVSKGNTLEWKVPINMGN